MELKKALKTVLFLVCMCWMVRGNPVQAEAAVWTDMVTPAKDSFSEDGMKARSGKYYFRKDGDSVRMSASPNGSYVLTPIRPAYGFYSTGKEGYYLGGGYREDTLYRYDYATRKSSAVIKLPGYDNWEMVGAWKNNIYLSSRDVAEYPQTFVYNLKKNTVKKIVDHCWIQDSNRTYAVGVESIPEAMVPVETVLYKFCDSGLKKVKTLTPNGLHARFAGGYLYYAEYSRNSSAPPLIFYRCRVNGTGVKKIHTVHERLGMLSVSCITSKYYEYYNGYQHYRYTYRTKKLTVIKR